MCGSARHKSISSNGARFTCLPEHPKTNYPSNIWYLMDPSKLLITIMVIMNILEKYLKLT